ncbi:flagellar hook-basal body complex protein FliE [Nocardioides sp. J9]|uniref:flagellar hook-basal body complex protein FliE n=1 Tax=unclassified Nocardioides TaxID=2615069 RepID=UPI00048F52B2|nr:MULTISPECIES: flagellar hook-basal body complex protein FliE [unclassified Nocardioides]TWG98625.1 flagellar hook-basal body complex protein FliE [Nocardioides sp. J9]
MDIMPLQFPTLSGSAAINPAMDITPATEVQGVAGADTEFGSLVLDGLDRLEGLTDKADSLAVDAATGKLENIHDYTIAASEAQVASQLTVALRNKAVEAFNEIMRMQV